MGGPLAGLRQMGAAGGAGALLAPARTLASRTALPRLLFAALWSSSAAGRQPPSARLTPDETAVLKRLDEQRPAQPKDCILFSDPNKDPDDVVSFVIGKPLEARGHVRIGHVVTTLGPSPVRAARAELARGVFDSLGMPQVAVSAGRDYDIGHRAADHGIFLPRGESLRARPPRPAGADSRQHASQTLGRAEGPVTLVAIAGMTDASALLREHEALVREKVGRIVVMGGIDAARDSAGFVQPDDRAYNNHTDLPAARDFYRLAQEYGIPLRIVTKEAAYQAAVPPQFYESLGQSGHRVGTYLEAIQRDSLQQLWQGIASGEIDKLDKRWFYDTFVARTAEDGADPPAFDDWKRDTEASPAAVWEHVSRLNLYDPLTLLAAVDGPSRMLFQPEVVRQQGSAVVEMIGAGQVAAPDDARTLMSALAKASLQG
ncbi:nucleoside hydrolase [Acidovorax sp. GBBC 3334]|uniref:type III secretion system effector XopQ n=1 Tax=Acidovorax sp. GBBC 3334 TaxID=2940496 RepID=UPI002302EC23|nr:type III secretion system effector XopQ [Acidovorax sp. GBBC 3334]MDA8456627.1 nucleoside hydrolase [Acidovorax sp. GBBC 3334]